MAPILLILATKYTLSRRSKHRKVAQLQEDIDTMKKSMKGMYTIQKALASKQIQKAFENEAILNSPKVFPKVGPQTAAGVEGVELSLDVEDPQSKAYFEVQWYWEEDAGSMNEHEDTMTLMHKGENFVQYSHSVSNEIEANYQIWLQSSKSQDRNAIDVDLTNRISTTGTEAKAKNAHTGCLFEVHFDRMKQVNKKSGFSRNVKRVQVKVDAPPVVPDNFGSELRASDIETNIPPLPEGINFIGDDAESILAARPGQIVQVARAHEDDMWLYGSVLVNEPGASDASSDGNTTTGWFPKSIAQVAGAEDLKRVAEAMGDAGAAGLAPPDTWQNVDKNVLQIFEVPAGSAECNTVETSFMHTLKNHHRYNKVKVS